MNAERRIKVGSILQLTGEFTSLQADAIAEAIEVALAWCPESAVEMQLAAVRPARWGCGCDARECVVRWDHAQGTGVVDPQAIVTAVCVTHGLDGRSHPGRVVEGVQRLRAQALIALDLAHQEQCR